MTESLRIAHCSDIHLDGNGSTGEYYRHAFAAALAEMRAHTPDLLMIAVGEYPYASRPLTIPGVGS